jgi:hypothetical protein
MSITVELVPDGLLQRLAKTAGPLSIEFQVWSALVDQRARDRQVSAFRVGTYWFTGSLLDARTEAALLAAAELDQAFEIAQSM